MADTKISALTENTTPDGSDLLAIIDDPGGTPASQRITVDNLGAFYGLGAGGASHTVSGSDATNTLTLAPTWNTTGAPTCLKIDVTSTAVNGQARWFSIEDDGTEKFFIQSNGNVFMNDGGTFSLRASSAPAVILSRAFVNSSNRGIVGLRSNGYLGWSSGNAGSTTNDIIMARAAAGVVSYLQQDGSDGGAFSTPTAGELTISAGAVTVTGGYHTIDTESDAATDDLDTISGGNDGQFLVIQAANAARTVVAKDGTGNLQLAGDFSLDNTQDTLTLIFSSALSAWCEISRSDSGA